MKEKQNYSVIFDVDGTILDSMGIWEHLGERYLRGHGIYPKAGLNEILKSMSMEQAAEYLKKTYGLLQTEEEIIKEVVDDLELFYLEEVTEKPGIRELITILAKNSIPMGIATSSPGKLVYAALERLGLLSFFSVILTCEEVGKGKEYPDIYEETLKALGGEGKREACIVFEDSPLAAMTAKKAGFFVVGVFEKAYEGKWEKAEEKADFWWEFSEGNVVKMMGEIEEKVKRRGMI